MSKSTAPKKRQQKIRTFQPWPKNQERLALAHRLGLNLSEIMNEALDQGFDSILKAKAKAAEERAKMLKKEWTLQVSNLRPLPCEGNALPLS